MSNYCTMKEIGAALGLSSHQIGRRLKTLGLRTEEGKPSLQAFQGGYCAKRWFGEHYLWAWNSEMVLALLTEQAGQTAAVARDGIDSRRQ